jgi:hypothetical protein
MQEYLRVCAAADEPHSVAWLISDFHNLTLDLQRFLNELDNACDAGELINGTESEMNKLADRLCDFVLDVANLQETLPEKLERVKQLQWAVEAKFMNESEDR